MRNLAIIPARSGSKGLPDKNIKELCEKPLIAYSIEAALESKMFDTVMVSTDSEAYAGIAQKYGAQVPFLRNKKTASDTATTWEVVLEVLELYEKQGKQYDTVTVLQPTTPLRVAEDIVKAYEVMEEKKALAVVSVCQCEHSPLWTNTLGNEFCMDGFLAKAQNKRRQDYDTYYRLNGAVYIVNVPELRKNGIISYDEHCFAYVMPNERSVDIDTQLDFVVAEAILANSRK